MVPVRLVVGIQCVTIAGRIFSFCTVSKSLNSASQFPVVHYQINTLLAVRSSNILPKLATSTMDLTRGLMGSFLPLQRWPNVGSMVEHGCSLIHYVSAVTEEDCLNGLGIVAGVTTACSKFGAYLCPWTLGIGCIVSAICEGVETGVVTDAKSACQACAQGRGSLEAMSYLQEGQEDILNLVNKVNDGIFQIHEKLDKITTQLGRIEIIVQYREIIVQYREIKRLFKYIKKDPETGLVVSDNNLENFLTLAMSLDAGLDRTLFQLFDLMNGIKGDPLLSNSIFTRYPEFCETEKFAYLWGMITDCILMESIAFSMSAGQGRRELRLEQIQENLIKISEQYVEDCGCTR